MKQKQKYLSDFSKIKPYDDEQVHDALVRILANPVFQQIIDWAFPKSAHAQLREDLLAAQTSLEFQKIFMYTGLKHVLHKTTPKGLHFTGEEYITDARPVSYISNHRDILLDSALLQVILVDLGLETSEITFGSNLIVNDFINDFGRINRMFTVFREGTPREMLQNAKDLSAYLQYTLQEKQRSIWIAQRKGRTKDGLDKTDPGLLKMFAASGSGTIKERIASADIVPLSISYEWEPCDALKVRELTTKQFGGEYKKAANEDMHSVAKGITNPKGGIHLSFCQPVNKVLDNFDDKQGNNPFLLQVVNYMDKEIIGNYKLWPSNYLAYDLATNSSTFADLYNKETKEYFQQRLSNTLAMVEESKHETAKQLFINLYANPVQAKLDLGFDIAQ